MNHRERVLAAIEHKQPDRVPLDLGSTVTSIHVIVYEELKRHLGIRSETVLLDKSSQLPLVEEAVFKRFDIDTRHVFSSPLARQPKKEEADGSYFDSWGVKRIPVGYYYEMPVDYNPLMNATIEDLKEYPWPDPFESAQKAIEYVKKKAKDLHEKTDYAIVYGSSGGFFEKSWYLTGFHRFFRDLKGAPSFVCEVMDRVIDFNIKFESEMLSEVGPYIDVVKFSDDLAMQDGPMMSMEMYRKYIKPRQRKVIQSIKRKTDAKILYHCCGSASHLFDDIIEIGVDIINPVQVSAKNMDTKMLEGRFGDKLCFWGAMDTQNVLPYGTPKEVEEEVKRVIRDLAPNGGYVLCAVHNIQPGVPPENIVVMYDAAKKWGRYPIT